MSRKRRKREAGGRTPEVYYVFGRGNRAGVFASQGSEVGSTFSGHVPYGFVRFVLIWHKQRDEISSFVAQQDFECYDVLDLDILSIDLL